MADPTRHPERTREGSGIDRRGRLLREYDQDDTTRKSPAMMLGGLLAGYVLLICIGYVVFRSDVAMVRGNEMSRDRALFTVINAATLTGFEQTVATNEYLPPGKWTIVALMFGGSIFVLLAGGVLVTRVAQLPYSAAEIAIATMAITSIACLSGAAALMAGGQPGFDALFLAISSLGNCGLHVGALPAIDDVSVHAVVLPLMIVGGLGVPVILDVRDRLLRRRACLCPFSQAVLATTAVVYLVGLVAFLCAGSAQSATSAWAAASTHAINSRGGGFPFAFAHTYSRPMQWVYMVFMLIGAASAGTAGGIKVNTFYEIVRGIRAGLKRQAARRSAGIALAWIIAYLAIVFIGLLAMLAVVPQMPADRLLFLVVSAAGNVGMSHDPIAIVKEGLYWLALLMMLGKFAPLMVLSWMAWTQRNTDDPMPVG